MKQNKKFIYGILASIVGSFIGALPWFLTYTFGNVVIGLLSLFIAIGGYLGYKFTKNDFDKKFTKTMYFSTIFTVTFMLLVIMPITKQLMNGYKVSFEWLVYTCKNWNLFSTFLLEYFVSVGIALIGTIGVVANVNKKEFENKKYGKIDTKGLFNYQSVSPEEIQKLKDAFMKNNAMSKETAVEREKVISTLSENMVEARASQVFNLIKDQQIIRKYKGKFYFSERAQNDELYRNNKLLIITLIASTVVIAIMVALTIYTKNITNNQNNNNTEEKTIIEVRENEHIIKYTGLKFVPKDGLKILTNSEKAKYESVMGYNFIAMNDEHTKMLYCFIDSEVNIQNVLTAREYLEQSLGENLVSEITTVSMAGKEFEKTYLKDAENQYTVECYITKINDIYVCFNYWYPEGENSNLGDMLEAVEQ